MYSVPCSPLAGLDFNKLFELPNSEKGGEISCVGYAPSQRRRCRCVIAECNKQNARSLLDHLPTLLSKPNGLQESLKRLAGFLLCRRFHQNQAESVAADWYQRVLSQSAMNANNLPQTWPQQESGSPKVKQETASVEQLLGQLKRQEDQIRQLADMLKQSQQHKTEPSIGTASFKFSYTESWESTCDEAFKFVEESRRQAEAEQRAKDEEQAKRERAAQAAEHWRQWREGIRRRREQFEIEQREEAARRQAEKEAEQARQREEKQRQEARQREEERSREARRQAEKEKAEREAERQRRAEEERAKRERAEAARKEEEERARERAKKESLTWEESWDRYNQGWEKLGASNPDGNDVRDRIPWPVKSGRWQDVTESAVRQFFWHAPPSSVSKDNPKFARLLRAQGLRWHPDKFNNSFPNLKDSDGVGKTALSVMQVINGLKDMSPPKHWS